MITGERRRFFNVASFPRSIAVYRIFQFKRRDNCVLDSSCVPIVTSIQSRLSQTCLRLLDTVETSRHDGVYIFVANAKRVILSSSIFFANAQLHINWKLKAAMRILWKIDRPILGRMPQGNIVQHVFNSLKDTLLGIFWVDWFNPQMRRVNGELRC